MSAYDFCQSLLHSYIVAIETIKNIKFYFCNESYSEEQEIERIILWTNIFLTEPISSPAFSTVHRYIIPS